MSDTLGLNEGSSPGRRAVPSRFSGWKHTGRVSYRTGWLGRVILRVEILHGGDGNPYTEWRDACGDDMAEIALTMRGAKE